MPKITWAILCNDFTVDKDRNNITLFQLVDQLNIPSDAFANGKVVVNTKLHLVYLLRRDRTELPKRDDVIVVELVAPNGENLFSSEMPAPFPESKHRLRNTATFEGLPIAGFGTHIFRLSLKTPHGPMLLGEIPLDVEVKTNPPM